MPDKFIMTDVEGLEVELRLEQDGDDVLLVTVKDNCTEYRLMRFMDGGCRRIGFVGASGICTDENQRILEV